MTFREFFQLLLKKHREYFSLIERLKLNFAKVVGVVAAFFAYNVVAVVIQTQPSNAMFTVVRYSQYLLLIGLAAYAIHSVEMINSEWENRG